MPGVYTIVVRTAFGGWFLLAIPHVGAQNVNKLLALAMIIEMISAIIECVICVARILRMRWACSFVIR